MHCVRKTGLAGSLAIGLLGALAPLSAQAQEADLNAYVGSWLGQGTASYSDGRADETVACRLAFGDGGAQRITFDGRCSLSGRTLSMSGTIAYVPENQRYEAIMSSNADFRGTAVGQSQGGALNFDLQQSEGAQGNVDASLSLADDSIAMSITATDAESGTTTNAEIPLRPL